MGASQVPQASLVDNWVLISSVTPTAAASTVSFTSISGYKKLMIKTSTPTLASTGTLSLTFNSDTGANYSYSSIGSDGGTALIAPFVAIANTNIPYGTGTTGTNFSQLVINDTNTSGIKLISGFIRALSVSGVQLYPSIIGAYFASAAITTVTLTTSTTFNAAGTVSLYGVAA